MPPISPREQLAYKTSGYTDSDIQVLYQLCVAIDDTYALLDLNEGQAREIRAALILCPHHPLAAKYRAAIARGAAAARTEANGTRFEDGTYRVGKQIKPGTYVVRNVEDCYWERQNRNGGIIDNYFTMSALRVQVSIRSSDYAFFSEGCGTWTRA